MERTVTIDGREVRLRASAAIPRLYRLKFRRDIIQDMRTIQEQVQRAQEAAEREGESSGSTLPLEALTLFENVAYLMARHGDPCGVPDSVDEWLDGFETFSIYTVFPVIQDLWAENLKTLNTAKKNSVHRAADVHGSPDAPGGPAGHITGGPGRTEHRDAAGHVHGGPERPGGLAGFGHPGGLRPILTED